jgi:5-methylcytosine-specific restriction endonuclease McrA
MASISETLRQQVSAEAGHCCEYCRTCRRIIGMPLVMDHIIPIAFGGSNERENFAAACYRCNEFKGSKTEGIDPATGMLIPLFNPRSQIWKKHFIWANGGTHIIGLTPTGRATVITLRMNNEYIVGSRNLWVAMNWYPPLD